MSFYSGFDSTVIWITLTAIVAGFLLVYSQSIGRRLCRGLSEEALLSGVSAHALASIGTGLIGIYLLGTSLPDTVMHIWIMANNDGSYVQPSIVRIGESATATVFGFFLIVTARWIGSALVWFRQLGLDQEPDPKAQSENKAQS